MQPVNSSVIAAVDYEPATNELFIQFRSNPKIYSYLLVPPSLYSNFMAAPSMGSFFEHYIKGHYTER